MSKRSPSSAVIDRVIAARPREILRAQGFRNIGRSFHREIGPLIHIVYFQADWLNNPERARFTINLGMTTAFFHETWTGTPMPRNPGGAAAAVTRRIGHLSPANLDKWWRATPETDAEMIGIEVATLLGDFGLPFFTRVDSVQGLLDLVNAEARPPYTLYSQNVVTAIVLASQGRTSEAKSLLHSTRLSSKVAGFRKTISLIERRLGFTNGA